MAIFWFVICLILIGVGFIFIERLRFRKMVGNNLKERKNESYETFLAHFKKLATQEDVLKAVYGVLSKWTTADEMPVRAKDSLGKVWGFEDDIDDLIFEVCKSLRMSHCETSKIKGDSLETVEDLVFAISQSYNKI